MDDQWCMLAFGGDVAGSATGLDTEASTTFLQQGGAGRGSVPHGAKRGIPAKAV